MGKGVNASEHLGRPSFGPSGLGRLAATGVRSVGATQKPMDSPWGSQELQRLASNHQPKRSGRTHSGLQLVAARDHNIHSHSLRLFHRR